MQGVKEHINCIIKKTWIRTAFGLNESIRKPCALGILWGCCHFSSHCNTSQARSYKDTALLKLSSIDLQVIFLNTLVKRPRALATDGQKHYSIPLDYPLKFSVIPKGNGKTE